MAFGISTFLFPEIPNELCDKLKLRLQEKQAGNNFDIFNEEIIAIADKLREDKFLSTKQQRFLVNKCLH